MIKSVALFALAIAIGVDTASSTKPVTVKPIEVNVVAPTGYIETSLRCPDGYTMWELKAVPRTTKEGFIPVWEKLGDVEVPISLTLEDDSPSLYRCWISTEHIPRWNKDVN